MGDRVHRRTSLLSNLFCRSEAAVEKANGCEAAQTSFGCFRTARLGRADGGPSAYWGSGPLQPHFELLAFGGYVHHQGNSAPRWKSLIEGYGVSSCFGRRKTPVMVEDSVTIVCQTRGEILLTKLLKFSLLLAVRHSNTI